MEEIQAVAPARKGGWPKGKPRNQMKDHSPAGSPLHSPPPPPTPEDASAPFPGASLFQGGAGEAKGADCSTGNERPSINAFTRLMRNRRAEEAMVYEVVPGGYFSKRYRHATITGTQIKRMGCLLKNLVRFGQIKPLATPEDEQPAPMEETAGV